MEGIVERLKQYRYGILILVVGIGLMLLPAERSDSADSVIPKEETTNISDSLEQILAQIEATSKEDTVPDQWESQILARILSRFHVVLISEADPTLVTAMKMHPAANLQQALAIAESLLGYPGSVTVIPEGISTIIR